MCLQDKNEEEVHHMHLSNRTISNRSPVREKQVTDVLNPFLSHIIESTHPETHSRVNRTCIMLTLVTKLSYEISALRRSFIPDLFIQPGQTSTRSVIKCQRRESCLIELKQPYNK